MVIVNQPHIVISETGERATLTAITFEANTPCFHVQLPSGKVVVWNRITTICPRCGEPMHRHQPTSDAPRDGNTNHLDPANWYVVHETCVTEKERADFDALQAVLLGNR